MPTAIPDWHLFRAFLTVVREGSLSSAARALGTTQPTMGRQVAALEASLGIKLFTRSLDGLSPTEAGLRLISSAEAMAAAVEAAQRSASGEVDEEQGTVRVTASNVIGGEVLPSILASFRAVHPRISVELALSNRNEDLLRGDADIAVAPNGGFAQVADEPLMTAAEQRTKLQLVEVVARYYWGNEI